MPIIAAPLPCHLQPSPIHAIGLDWGGGEEDNKGEMEMEIAGLALSTETE